MIALSAVLAPALAAVLAFALAARARARHLAVELQLTRQWLDGARADSRAQLERHLREVAMLRDRQAAELREARDGHASELALARDRHASELAAERERLIEAESARARVQAEHAS